MSLCSSVKGNFLLYIAQQSKSGEETKIRNKELDSKNGKKLNVSPSGNTLKDQSEADFSKGHVSWQSALGLLFKG